MAPTFSANTERRLVWETEIPSKLFKRTSPLFYFQKCEWRFELRYGDCNPQYVLYMVSMSGQKLPQAFRFASYIEYCSDLIAYRTYQVTDINESLRVFNEVYGHRNIDFKSTAVLDELFGNRNIDFKSIGVIKLVMIFHDEVGMTLRLPSENEKFRNVAVGTNDDSSTTSQSALEILSNDFSKLLDEDLYQDVELQCEDHTFKVHKSVLSTRSKVFLAMLQSDMIEGQTGKIEVKDMKSDVCNLLLHYIYTGKLLELTPENARSVYEAGDRYNVGGLMEPCAEFLIRNLTPDNACEMLVLADAHSDQHFKETVIEYVLDENIPRKDDTWQDFCCSHPLLATQVLNKFYTLHDNK